MAKISLEKKIEGAAPSLISLAKKAAISLEKKQLLDVTVRVGLVLDASGSMQQQYLQQKVQGVIERVLPLAVHFSDNLELDVWAFSDSVKTLPHATLNNYIGYTDKIDGGWNRWRLMGGTDVPLIIENVIDYYKNSPVPAFVIFISDGDVHDSSRIASMLKNASSLPIFWQFVGLGGRNYGVFKQLDTMSGRVVDNCNFFELDDLYSVSDEELYNLLLTELPDWLKLIGNLPELVAQQNAPAPKKSWFRRLFSRS
jgi:hypothetical protein